MISRSHLSALLAIAAVLWGTLLMLSGTSVSFEFFKPFSTVIGALVLILTLFDKWLWRLPILHPWFVATPDLQGTWKGTIASTWIDPKTNNTLPPIEAYLVIKQTFSSIHLRMFTKESESESVAGEIVRERDGCLNIAGVYRNTPKLLLRQESPIHHGGKLLHVRGEPPDTLEGQYWTDRNTKGEMKFTAQEKAMYHNFESASMGKYRKK